MHSSVIKLVVDRVSEILNCNDPFLGDTRTKELCNELLQFMAGQCGKSPMFACAIWHYLLDHDYQIGNLDRHSEFVEKFRNTLESITPEKRVMLRKISDKLFVKSNQIQA